MPATLEARVASGRGIRRVRASSRTRNVLVEYDPDRLNEAAVVRRLARAVRDVRVAPEPAARPSPRRAPGPVLVTHASAGRARIAVPGLDRETELGRQLVERIGRRPGVRRVVPSPLTGRVLVEFDDAVEQLQAILDDIADVAPPDGDEHELPAHPLDPAPIIEGAARVVGATLGLSLLVGRRATGATTAPVTAPGPGEIAGGVVLLEGVPRVAHGLEDLLGHERKELLFAGVGIVSMTTSGGALGLLFAGVAGLRVLTEALARRRAWREYERRLGDAQAVYPGAELALEAGRRVPLRGRVVDGTAIGQSRDGTPQFLVSGAGVDAGVTIHGGPVTVRLTGAGPVPRAGPDPRAHHDTGTADGLYLRVLPFAALLAALGTAVVTRSPGRALTTLLVLNPRPALAGAEHADRAAAARVLRAGVTVVGSRSERPVRRPDVLVLDGARTLCDGWELREAVATGEGHDTAGVLALAGAVAAAAGSPWGTAVPGNARAMPADGAFDGRVASASVDGERWTVGPEEDGRGDGALPAEPGDQVLLVRRERDGHVAGALALRPRMAGGAAALVAACRARAVRAELVSARVTGAVRAVAARAGVPVVAGAADQRVSAMRAEGLVVAVVGDGADSGPAFDAADLAIGLSSGLSGPFAARADVLAPRLEAVAAIVEAGARRDLAVRDATALSIASNLAGAAWALRAAPPFRAGGKPVLLGGLAAMLDAAVRLGGGRRERTVVERLTDPLPERWGRVDAEAVLQRLRSSPQGLTWEQADGRWTPPAEPADRRVFVDAVARQLASPLVAFLAGGAALSLGIGAPGDAAMIGAVVVANALIGAWQEHQAGEATRALRQLGPPLARVLRAGREEEIPARRLVPGDVLVLAPGDRVPADARLLETTALEVDEAALTGESVPVSKSALNGTDASHVVLEGTDVTAGTGHAVVVAVGAGTRMGAIAAALGEDARGPSALDDRLGQIMWRALPFIALGGALVTVPGIAFGRPVVQQLALGASLATAAVPEGLPVLAGVAEAGVARRLAHRHALVTRLSAVEALGRVDVACADKTGTLTSGRLALRCVADTDGRAAPPEALPPDLLDVLRTAALASPSPAGPAATAHPTDVAVVEGARAAGVADGGARRGAETPFDPVRGFHATVAGGRIRLKGAAEILAPRCSQVRTPAGDRPLDVVGREALLRHTASLAADGLRVLLVAEGDPGTAADDPEGLVATGFVGIGDPLRPTSRAAVARCREAGVRVVMLTGDHPATAAAVAGEVGLPYDGEHLLTGTELAALDDDALARRLEHATVIARSTPLDKLRIVEALRLRGHVVAMTGDGVNDAPALRLADVGVAMGRHGTEVARHASDLILTDDDFATLAEALVEGRGFWGNMRRALGLLLGGNAGEVVTIVAVGATGLASGLTTRQVLTVNLVSDALPAMTVAMRPPPHRDLATLSREGGTALDAPLRAEILRRAAGTAVPSLAACALAAGLGGAAAVGPVAFLSVMGTQLAQTLQMAWTNGRPDPAIAGAVAGSVSALALGAALPATRTFLGLGGLTPGGIGLALAASVAAPAVAGAVPVPGSSG
ncbi:MAG TPA: HAD-IC family P-type ATPase [Baekduia sp.]|uniref:HAD-IC family P-type ATPase n=1 Tax=Baekduia sp. TaxID=2600305 RepID=UPI002B6D218F|nr:HAD-IC family P-type ATPase [Baekduia sp.]HMJ37166.1 HAD-IC family P-type ATPase [Baekduia sp.]